MEEPRTHDGKKVVIWLGVVVVVGVTVLVVLLFAFREQGAQPVSLPAPAPPALAGAYGAAPGSGLVPTGPVAG